VGVREYDYIFLQQFQYCVFISTLHLHLLCKLCFLSKNFFQSAIFWGGFKYTSASNGRSGLPDSPSHLLVRYFEGLLCLVTALLHETNRLYTAPKVAVQ
jgi:hypothetical protein